MVDDVFGIASHTAQQRRAQRVEEEKGRRRNLIEFLDRRRVLEFLVERVREQRPGSV